MINCPACNKPALDLSSPDLAANRLEQCAVVGCGCREFFVQRDFNQKLGIAIFVAAVLIGLVLHPFPLMLYVSLGVAALLDLLFYFLIGDVTICYKCAAHYREAERLPSHTPFDLVTYDEYKFGRRK